ncbi:MAG: hypothetical protein D6805_06145 [Planctomycetota bacterium]|nr:MAG: hypothetical protein D6805_06145 [Planctomycetota bacterium]
MRVGVFCFLFLWGTVQASTLDYLLYKRTKGGFLIYGQATIGKKELENRLFSLLRQELQKKKAFRDFQILRFKYHNLRPILERLTLNIESNQLKWSALIHIRADRRTWKIRWRGFKTKAGFVDDGFKDVATVWASGRAYLVWDSKKNLIQGPFSLCLVLEHGVARPNINPLQFLRFKLSRIQKQIPIPFLPLLQRTPFQLKKYFPRFFVQKFGFSPTSQGDMRLRFELSWKK